MLTMMINSVFRNISKTYLLPYQVRIYRNSKMKHHWILLFVSEEEEPEWVEQERELFRQELDVNTDGYLNLREMKRWISNNDMDPALAESKHLMSIADDDINGELDVEEMLAHFDVFMTSSVTQFGDLLVHRNQESGNPQINIMKSPLT